MDKKRPKIALAILNAVRSIFPETNEFIDSTSKKECEKEKMTADEVISFASKLSKKKKKKKISLDKHFCFRFGTIGIIFLFIDVETCGR